MDTLDPSREPDHLFVFLLPNLQALVKHECSMSVVHREMITWLRLVIQSYYILILILRRMKSRIFVVIMYKYHNSITLDQVDCDIIALSSCFRFTILNCKTRIASN